MVRVIRLFTRRTFLLSLICALSMLLHASIVGAQSDLSEGTYSISYTVLKPENDSASMANDYWEKPATVILKNGVWTVQTTINHSQWVSSFKVSAGSDFKEAKTISANTEEDKRVAQFSVDDLSKPLLAKIHVIVETIDYNHKYSIKLVFDMDSLKLVKASEPEVKKDAKDPALESTGNSGSKTTTTDPVNKTDEKVNTSKDTPVVQSNAGKEASGAVTNKTDGKTAPAATAAPAKEDPIEKPVVEIDNTDLSTSQPSIAEDGAEAESKQNEASEALKPAGDAELDTGGIKADEPSPAVSEEMAALEATDEKEDWSSNKNAVLVGSIPLLLLAIAFLIWLWKRKKSNQEIVK